MKATFARITNTLFCPQFSSENAENRILWLWNLSVFWRNTPLAPLPHPRKRGLTAPSWYSRLLCSNLLAASIYIETPCFVACLRVLNFFVTGQSTIMIPWNKFSGFSESNLEICWTCSAVTARQSEKSWHLDWSLTGDSAVSISVVILVFLKFLASWGPFLESLGNFLGPKSNIYLKNKRIKSRVLADKPYFVLFTGQ